MSKFLFKLNKKLGQGIRTLTKVEKRKLEDLTTKENTKNYIIIHFGVGNELDFMTIKNFLLSLKIQEKNFFLNIFPGFCHGFLKFENEEEKEKLENYLKKENNDEKYKIKDNFKNIKMINNTNKNFGMLKKNAELDFSGKKKNVFFLQTLLNENDLKCAKADNALNSATKDYKQFQKLGLYIVENVLSEKEEDFMFENIKKRKWENLSHRRVQHFGHRFIYGMNGVNKNKEFSDIPEYVKLPLKSENWEDFRNFDNVGVLRDHLNGDVFDQITINEYKPGAGIPPHVDSHAPFEEPIISVSLFADIVMTFKNLETSEEIHIFLPKRSALVLTGEIRYLWSHTIASRKIDRVEKELLFRRTRLSLTYRITKPKNFCDCKFPTHCDYQKTKKQKTVENRDKITDKQLEKKYVKDVYNAVAEHFSHTRYKAWPSVQKYLESLPKNSLIGDIGCGNGKYIFCTKKHLFFGTDIARNFGLIIKKKDNKVQFCVSDIGKLPFKSNFLDNAISIAVVHHMASLERRKKAVSELLRIVKKKGEILIYVWAFEQEKDFGGIDVFVPWNNQKKYERKNDVEDKIKDGKKNVTVYKRFYHLFQKGELEDLVLKAGKEFGIGVEVLDSGYSHQNWWVCARKL